MLLTRCAMLLVRRSGQVRVPAFAEVFPGGIGHFDQSDLLGARPVFELLFAINGLSDVAKSLEPDEAVAIVGG